MSGIADKIMKWVAAHHRGRWVCSPKDFLDLGSWEAVDQALLHLVKAGRLCWSTWIRPLRRWPGGTVSESCRMAW